MVDIILMTSTFIFYYDLDGNCGKIGIINIIFVYVTIALMVLLIL